MNYLLDRKLKRKKFSYIAFFAVLFVVLFYFRTSIFYGLSYISSAIFRPVLVLGNNIGNKLASLSSFFVSKNFLIQENKNLKMQLDGNEARLSNYNSILEENTKLKEILGRSSEKAPMILGAILEKPNQSLYDTLIIDVGTEKGIKEGNTVFAFGDVPVGRISSVYLNSSKVILFSNSREKTQVVVGGLSRLGETGKDVFMEVVGRGGGNFEMVLPRDFMLARGDQAVLPGIMPYVLGVVETIISDPRDPFQKALLVSPVNIQELKFVEVKIQK